MTLGSCLLIAKCAIVSLVILYHQLMKGCSSCLGATRFYKILTGAREWPLYAIDKADR